MRDIEVDYVVRDGGSIAFEVFGSGPVDLALLNNRFPIDLMWELPQLASFMEALGRLGRVIAYDPRGHGASDPFPTTDSAAVLEGAAADLLAVLDATGSERVTTVNLYSGSTELFLAGTYPERVRSLVVAHLRTSYPELRGFSAQQRAKMARALATTRGLRSDNPRAAHDRTLAQWWPRARRLNASPSETVRQMEYASNVDLEPVLEAVRAPALVFHRRDNRLWDIETSRAAAARIPNARFVELPGSELDLFLGDTTPVLSEIAQFLGHHDTPAPDDRTLATILFTDIAASTEQLATVGDRAWRRVLDEHDQTIERTVLTHRGRLIKTLGDGILATFDGPARGVHCAAALRDALAGQGIQIRAGLHTGEIELRGPDVAGIAVHVASRVSALARAGEILTTRTVVDLTSGSGITYEPRGEHELKGVPGSWPVYAARTPDQAAP